MEQEMRIGDYVKNKNLGGEKKKMKYKTIAFVEIAIVLCSVFLVSALPAIAAEQNTQKISASTITTASKDDYVLDIYGNANEDDTIDMRDLTYVKLIFFGKKPETELADAKYDGKINPLDFIQIKLIIVGKEKEITVIDTADRAVTVKKPVRRIVTLHIHPLETLRSLGVQKDLIVGIGEGSNEDTAFFSEFSDVPSVGGAWSPDCEAILKVNPDIAILHSSSTGTWGEALEKAQTVLESAGIRVLRFNFNQPEIYLQEVNTFGYIFNRQSESEALVDWYENILNTIKERIEELSEEDKPKVYFESYRPYTSYPQYGYIAEAGGKDIFTDEPGGSVDPEAVISRDPDIIVRAASWIYGGYHLDADDITKLLETQEEIMSRPELQRVKAVRGGRVYIITPHSMSYMPASGCRWFLQHAYFAKWFHPELFKDFNPKAIHQEYLTSFQRLDIDLDKKGVFVYPEPS